MGHSLLMKCATSNKIIPALKHFYVRSNMSFNVIYHLKKSVNRQCTGAKHLNSNNSCKCTAQFFLCQEDKYINGSREAK